jgi:LysR family hydrogen peroxide-inducible transcriptional activator
VLEVCPQANRIATNTVQKSLEGTSLETIRQMVASGAGITVLPSTATDSRAAQSPLIAIREFVAPVPSRRIALAWRTSFPRPQAIEAVRQAVLAAKLPGVTLLPNARPTAG